MYSLSFFRFTRALAILAPAACLFIPWPADAAAQQRLLLVDRKQAHALIVVDPASSRQVKDAAATLGEYIQKSTGVTLPVSEQLPAGDSGTVAIHVGKTDVSKKLSITDLDADGFILKAVDDKNYVIIGGSDWGTEFGVYDFLERYLGVRWLMPTELGTEIPRHAFLTISGKEIREEPVYLSRQLSPIEITRLEPPKPYSPWRQYSFGDQWGRFNRARGRLEYHHHLKKLFPPAKFAESHPEFYPMVKGKRLIPKDGNDFRWQPNFSAPGIVEAAADEIKTYFRKNPEAESYSLGVNDLRFFDESPESKARRSGKINAFGYEDVSDDYYRWVNDVVTLVAEEYPQKRFGLLAYSAVAEPPQRTGIAPQVVPFLTYERLRWADPTLRERDQQQTLRWGEVASTLGWYDYVYGRNYLIPRVWFHQMQEYLRWGRAHKVRYYTAELYPNWGEGPKPWIMTKLLWNPDLDVDALLDDWYVSAVGKKAAPQLRAYYALWESFWTKEIFQQIWDESATTPAWNRRSGQYLPFEIATYLLGVPPDLLKQSREALTKAMELADTPRHKARVAKLVEMWEIYESSVRLYQRDNRWREADLRTEAQALAFFEQCKATIQESAERLKKVEALREDDLHGHSVYRIARSDATHGSEWGTTSLWSLVPWLGKSAELRTRLEALSTQSGNPKVRELTTFVLASAQKAAKTPGKPLLANGTFSEGIENWSLTPQQVADDLVWSEHPGVQISRFGEVNLSQLVPCEPGSYYGIVTLSLPPESEPPPVVDGNEAEQEAILTLATLNRNGRQSGRELPSGKIPLHPGQKSTFVVPFTLDNEVTRIDGAHLRVTLKLNGFHPDQSIVIEEIQIHRVQ